MNKGGNENRVWGIGNRVWGILSVLLGCVFMLNCSVFAQEAEIEGNKPKDVFELTFPLSWGRVKEVYKGSTKEVIVHIQDAHNNYEAQTNIANILDLLVEDYGLLIAGIEGSSGKIYTELFSTFPDDDARYAASDYFVRDGTFSGPEALVIRKGFEYPLKLYGIENQKFYDTNLAAFKDSLPFKKEAKSYFQNLGEALGKIKSYIYTPKLFEIDEKQLAYGLNFISLNDYCLYLEGFLEDKDKIEAKYPNFSKLFKAIKIEENLNFAKAEEERTKLLTELTNILSEDDIGKLLDAGLAYKREEMSASRYLSFIRDLSKENSIDFNEYKNLDKYIEYASSYEEIQSFELFNEIEEIDLAIRSELYSNEAQGKMDFLIKGLRVMKRLVDIKMVNKDLEFYKKYQEDLKVDKYLSFINEQSAEYGINVNLSMDIGYLDVYIPAWVEFYRVAGLRDEAMINNTLSLMKEDKQNLGAMVTGGFHTRKLTEMMKERGISFMVITPRITKNIPGPYFDRLTGKKTAWEEFLK